MWSSRSRDVGVAGHGPSPVDNVRWMPPLARLDQRAGNVSSQPEVTHGSGHGRRNQHHGEEERRPGIWQLAFPSILGNLSFTLVAMVQTKFVGELGAQALAAVGAGQRVFFAMQAILMAVSVGTTALVARAWGARDYRKRAGSPWRRWCWPARLRWRWRCWGSCLPGRWPACSASTRYHPRPGCGQHPLAVPVQPGVRGQLHPRRRPARVRRCLVAAVDQRHRQPAEPAAAVRAGAGQLGRARLGVAGAAISIGISFTVGALLLIGLWVGTSSGSSTWAAAGGAATG
jgi:hypothetical protein